MRCFIAIDPSEEIRSFLKHLDLPDAQFNRTHSYHITLKFLGEVENIEIIKEKLASIKWNPLTLTLDKMGVFPHDNYIRVAWVGIKESSEVTQLQAVIDANLPGKSEKNFHPHFTLGRTRKLKDKKAFMNYLKSTRIEPLSCKVTKFTLYKSTLTKKGPIYKELASFHSKT